MKRIVRLVLVVGFVLGLCRSTEATTITFAGETCEFVSSLTVQDVTFTAAPGTFDCIPGVPNLTTGLLSNFDVELGRPLFRADISVATSFVSVDLGDFNADPDTLVLRAYSSTNVLLDSSSLLIDASSQTMHTLSVSSANIAYVIFGAEAPATNGNSVYADNFTYTLGDQTPVPEPASLTLLGLGLAGIAGRRWRQRKAS